MKLIANFLSILLVALYMNYVMGVQLGDYGWSVLIGFWVCVSTYGISLAALIESD